MMSSPNVFSSLLWLVLIATALMVAPAAGMAACDKQVFEEGRNCGDAGFRCDDGGPCFKGADAATCPDTPSAALAVGQSVAVRAVVEDRNMGVTVLVCNATECGRLDAARRGEGALSYQWSKGCDLPHWGCCRRIGRWTFGYTFLPAGPHSLVLERRVDQLAVWPAGRPDNVGLVDAPDGDNLTVRLRAWRYNEAFSAEFGQVGTAEGTAHVDRPPK